MSASPTSAAQCPTDRNHDRVLHRGFHEHGNARGLIRPDGEIPLPMHRLLPILDDLGTIMDRAQLRGLLDRALTGAAAATLVPI